jgi:hypothetical protein
MIPWFISFALIISASFAEVGKVSKIIGSGDAYIFRNQQKMLLAQDTLLEQGDELFTMDSVVVVYLYPTTQMSLSKNTQIKITESLIDIEGEKDKSFSVINFIKGLVRLQVTKDENLEIDQKVVADGVAFGVRGTEFEVSKEGEDFDLDVIEGEVEVSSPFVQTFVPEIVKANEGFRFNKKAKNFQRRKFFAKFKNHPEFANKKEMREKWKQKRMEKRQKRNNNQTVRNEKRSERVNGRQKNNRRTK